MTIHTQTHATAYYAANNAYNWAYQYLWSEGGRAIADVAAYKAAMGVYEKAGVADAEPARSRFDAYDDAYRVYNRLSPAVNRRSMERGFDLRKITHAAGAYADLVTAAQPLPPISTIGATPRAFADIGTEFVQRKMGSGE